MPNDTQQLTAAIVVSYPPFRDTKRLLNTHRQRQIKPLSHYQDLPEICQDERTYDYDATIAI